MSGGRGPGRRCSARALDTENAMKRKRRVTKPSGRTGFFRVRLGSEGVELTKSPTSFPAKKEAIEFMVARDFAHSEMATSELNLDPVTLLQNDTDDFDFSIATPTHDRYDLELLEVAPISTEISYDSASPVIPGYSLAEFVLHQIEKKARRYGFRQANQLILLLYSTDWKFVLVPPITTIVQKWLADLKHPFAGIYYYFPIVPGEGSVETLFPVPDEMLAGFDPEAHRNFVLFPIDPMSFETTGNLAVEGEEPRIDGRESDESRGV